jgi:HSP20 family protein
MNLEKLKPWNWFKHEDDAGSVGQTVPVKRAQHSPAADSLTRLHDEMDRWFDQLSSSLGLPRLGSRPTGGMNLAGVYRPQIDVSGDDKRYQIELDVPGMSESDLSIEVRDDLLVISGEKREDSEDKGKHYYRVERSYGAFQRTLALPDDANADEIDARLEKGVLRLEIPRRESSAQKARRIDIAS